jgi:predicted metal-dependent phosphoesterase TrpH
MDVLLNWFIGFFIWFLVLVVFAIITVLVVGGGINPKSSLITDDLFDYNRKSEIIPKDAFLMDTHAHTLASDGKMTPEQLIKWEIANGFNAFTLTDHNTDKNNEEILALQSKYPNILIIPGFEWTTNRIHLNFIGLKRYPHRVPINPSDEDIKFAIKSAKELGAVVQVDHISWTLDQPRLRSGELKHPTRAELLEWGVDGV